MSHTKKLGKLMSTSRDPNEVQDWMFSLIPIGVAFAFYVILILQAGFEPKSLFIAIGAAAGLIGLQSYWVIRGWRKHHGSTVVLGIVGIALVILGLNLFIDYS